MSDRIFWGDLHNHNTVGLFNYTKGSLERSIDLAQSHLDFFAFTGHAQWHDMPPMPGGVEEKWNDGFAHHARLWEDTKRAVYAANRPGTFVAFVGYEWHSAAFGDYCVIYQDDGPLEFAGHVRELQEHVRRCPNRGAVMIPHHLGYQAGIPGRGVNWDFVDETVSPVVEIFSEHGGSERDRGPFPYVRHSNGPRTTAHTLQHGLARGLHVGAIASSDNHWAHPGAYGEGMVAIIAPELTREALWDALWRRRCYAVTGERIELDVRLDGEPMGAILPPRAARCIEVAVRGWDEIQRVEVLKNNRVIYRYFPEDAVPAGGLPWSRRYRLRVEFGWGPWAAFAMPRIADWLGTVELDGARIVQAMPCFQAGPFVEEKRSKILERTETRYRWQSHTSRSECLDGNPNNAVVLDVEGPPDARISLRWKQPTERSHTFSLGHLAATSEIGFTDVFPSESYLLHRLVPDELAAARFSFVDTDTGPDSRAPSPPGGEDCYYVRVFQENGHAAWSSPIWVRGA